MYTLIHPSSRSATLMTTHQGIYRRRPSRLESHYECRQRLTAMQGLYIEKGVSGCPPSATL